MRLREKLWLAPVVIITACFILPFYVLMILVGLPLFLISCWRDERVYRRRMRLTGRVLQWREAVDRVRKGRGLLFVQMIPTGAMAHIWWVETSRDEVDPRHELPDAGIHAAMIENEQWVAMERIHRERLRWIAGQAWLVRVPLSLRLFPKRLRCELGAAGALAVEGRPLA